MHHTPLLRMIPPVGGSPATSVSTADYTLAMRLVAMRLLLALCFSSQQSIGLAQSAVRITDCYITHCVYDMCCTGQRQALLVARECCLFVRCLVLGDKAQWFDRQPPGCQRPLQVTRSFLVHVV
jgi:hypothetical protein